MSDLLMGEKIPDGYNQDLTMEEPNADNTVTEGGSSNPKPYVPPKMIEHQQIDMDTGAIIDVVVVDVNNETVPEDCKEGWGNRVFFDPIFDFTSNDWVENKPDQEVLDYYKTRKDEELNQACQDAILDGFEHTIDGLTYKFSYDMQAQTNFGDSRALLNDGVITEIPWTVKHNGEYTRIVVDKPTMDALTLTILQHKSANIGKYRDTLLPRVADATTIEEIQAVDWSDV